MSNEIQVSSSLRVTPPSGAPYYRPWSFSMSPATVRGPTPGLLTATVSGVQIDLGKLTNPGVCWLQNLSSLYRIEVGLKDTSSGFFEPMLELGPLEAWPVPLARQLGSELTSGVGTGTAGSGGVLWAKAVGGSADFLAEAFER